MNMDITQFQGENFNMSSALDWIEENILKDFSSAPMSWITHVNKNYSEGIDYCPECAKKEIARLVSSGEYPEGELQVCSDNSIEDDGCNVCSECGINLECSSVGTWIDEEIDDAIKSGCDSSHLFNICESRCSQDDYINNKASIELIRGLFTSGKILDLVKKESEAKSE